MSTRVLDVIAVAIVLVVFAGVALIGLYGLYAIFGWPGIAAAFLFPVFMWALFRVVDRSTDRMAESVGREISGPFYERGTS